jgi:ubiquinone/menaquinone biosynthesis C-methylase UbiE
MIEVADAENTVRPPHESDKAELFLEKIGKIFNIPDITEPPQDEPQVVTYYWMNKLTFRLLVSWGGFIHSGVTYDGIYKRDDVKEPARIVERYMREMDAKSVLELAYGLGSNSAFLARRNSRVKFEAIDLAQHPLRSFRKISNLRFHSGDYHDLSRFDDTAFDVAFIIESLCYSKDKLRFLREVKKKLKTNGLLIIFDGYKTNDAMPCSQSEYIISKLVSKGMAVDSFERVGDVEDYMRQEFSIEVSKDISAHVLPFWEFGEVGVHFYFNHPIFAKTVNKILPPSVARNLLAPLLIAPVLRWRKGCYYLHVLRNDH